MIIVGYFPDFYKIGIIISILIGLIFLGVISEFVFLVKKKTEEAFKTSRGYL